MYKNRKCNVIQYYEVTIFLFVLLRSKPDASSGIRSISSVLQNYLDCAMGWLILFQGFTLGSSACKASSFYML